MPETFTHPELVNLAEKMDEDKLKDLGILVVEEYESDKESRAEWEEKHAQWAKIYYQMDYTGDPERDWGSDASVPLLTEACNQFAARSRKAFFPNKDFVTTSLVSLGTFPAGIDTATVMVLAQQKLEAYRSATARTQKHMNYQLTVKNPTYKQEKDSLFLSMALHGSVFSKSSWDRSTGQPRVETVRASDLIVPYNVGPVRIEDVPRKTHRIVMSLIETKMLAKKKFFTSECVVATNIEQKTSELNAVNAQMEGTSNTKSLGDKQTAGLCVVLEQHRYWEIKNPSKKKDAEDTIVVPVIVWVDLESREVKRLTIRYETDDTGEPLHNREAVEYFDHYKFFENPDGFYGYGYGHMLAKLNSAVNSALRGSIDAGTLANDGNMSGFISQRLCPQDDAGEEFTIQMGKLTTVQDTSEDIDKGIKMMQFPGPNQAHVELMQYLDERGQRLGSVTEASTGQVDKIRQSNALMTELEQALELPSNIHMRIVDSLTSELQKIYRLNRIHLDEQVVFVLNDKAEVVNKADYQLEAIVSPTFDPKMATMAQKIARAQTELDATMKNPLAMQDPNVIIAAFRRFYEAIDTENIDELLPQQQEAPEPQRIDDQRAENMLFLMPDGSRPLFDVFADQNHHQHISIIDEMVKSEYGKELTPESAQALHDHRAKHVAYLYGIETGATTDGQPAGPAAENVNGMGADGADPTGAGNPVAEIPGAGAMAPGPVVGAAPKAGGGAVSA